MLLRAYYCFLLVLSLLLSDTAWSSQKPVITQGDIVVANELTARSIAIVDDSLLWPNGIIPYTVDDSLPNASRAAALQAIDKWNAVAGITLMPVAELERISAAPVRDSINFVPGDFCASWVGRRGGQQEVWVSANCAAGSVMHEIGHVLGLEHEHTRPDRDQYISIHWENITPDKQHNFDTAALGSRLPGAYDYGSIMHYGTHNFSSNGRATISAIDGSAVLIGQRTAPSDGDIAAIASLYGSDLAVVSRVVRDVDIDEMEIYVSNQSTQGAHDVSVELDAPVNLSSAENDIDGWACASLAPSDAVRCTIMQLPGGSVKSLMLDVSDLEEASIISATVASKTADPDLSNNQSTAQGGDSIKPEPNQIPPALLEANAKQEPIQDDAVAGVALNGGALNYLMLMGWWLLLLHRKASGRIYPYLCRSFLAVHRR